MAMVKVPKGSLFIRRGERTNTMYMLAEGSVRQKTLYETVTLPAGSTIGIEECVTGQYQNDYIALEDCVLYPLSYSGTSDLERLLRNQPKYGEVLLYTAVRDAGYWLNRYDKIREMAKRYEAKAAEFYQQYQEFCKVNGMEEETYSEISSRTVVDSRLRIGRWEVEYYNSLYHLGTKALADYYGDNYGVLAGQILYAGRAMASAVEAVDAWSKRLQETLEAYMNPQGNDMFALYFGLEREVANSGGQWEEIHARTQELIDFIRKSGRLDVQMVEERLREYEQYDFTGALSASAQMQEDNEAAEDCLTQILHYAGKTTEEMEQIRSKVEEFRGMSEDASGSDHGRKLSRELSNMFYEVYQKVFLRSVQEGGLTKVLKAFLYFGFMDTGTAGEENAEELYRLAGKISVCQSVHVYTIYDWLKSIYEGKNEPSRNEFDLDYTGYLAEQRRMGKIRVEQIEEMKRDQWAKTVFEMENMFVTTNRATHGRISGFCPILSSRDMIQSGTKMLVTAKRIEDAINAVRQIDYSLFFREVGFSDPAHGINSEQIQKEVLPDVILMPNVGSRAMMWQETAGVKRDTSARFVLPIMTIYSLEDMILETCGRFRWEMCRKIQGMRWNDITEKSLTSEYCDYLQFYRKNRDLTAEVKEKLRNALVKSKNNFREVFVMDYVNWIKFESNGSYRLNRVARDIIFRYCPFARSYREALAVNPIYQDMIQRFQILRDKKRKLVEGFGTRYEKNGGEMTIELQENLTFYSM
ncbi:MAG: cyclic nucleotide-binding domain-containing protein [Lachnospiraceae bacterium]|nr:cyclic nucleotide-binding domain-containing protein [Lachnospiraceae bacterium]